MVKDFGCFEREVCCIEIEGESATIFFSNLHN